jgi:hypothetical protein
MEHVHAFKRHSRFPVYEVNVEGGFPPGLENMEPGAIVMHYTLFGSGNYLLSAQFLDWLDRSRAYKVCFFQDEFYYCGRRFRFLNQHSIDCVFTHVEPEYFDQVYGRYTKVPRLEHNVPGYVSQELLNAADRYSRSEAARTIDVGYRGRSLPLYMGRGAQEKTVIGTSFAQLGTGTRLQLDIDTKETARLYGEHWYEFVASCRYVLGVESGASLFDLEDEVRHEHNALVATGREPTLEELEDGALGRWDDRIPYRTISPRHFEAAALRTGQILFEGRYSGAMQPMVHYIPLRKDFSNFDEVIERVRDRDLRAELVANAHRDLVSSGDWSYARMTGQLDRVLRDVGLRSPRPGGPGGRLARSVRRRRVLRQPGSHRRWLLWGLRAKLYASWIAPLGYWARRAVGIVWRARAHAIGGRPSSAQFTAVEPLEQHWLRVSFADGAVTDVDLSELLAGGGKWAAIRDSRGMFEQVRVNPESKTVEWPNGVELDPNLLNGNSESGPRLSQRTVSTPVTSRA